MCSFGMTYTHPGNHNFIGSFQVTDRIWPFFKRIIYFSKFLNFSHSYLFDIGFMYYIANFIIVNGQYTYFVKIQIGRLPPEVSKDVLFPARSRSPNQCSERARSIRCRPVRLAKRAFYRFHERILRCFGQTAVTGTK